MVEERSSTSLMPLGPFGPRPGERWPDGPLEIDRTMPEEVRPKVIRYLESCPMFLAWMEYTRDVIGDRFGVSGGSAIMSDGTYYWRLDAVDYVREYGIAVPDEVLAHMESHNWTCPEIDQGSYGAIYRELESTFLGDD